MTKVVISYHDKQVTSIAVSEHSGYGKRGEDIVCAALSSAMQIVMIFADKNLNKNSYVYEENATRAYASITITKEINIKEKQIVQPMLETIAEFIRALRHEYPGYVRVEEEDV